jgi:polygalacturonase
MADYNIRAYGALGDGHTNDAVAIQAAIDACNAAGGGRVIVPSGATFLTGTFTLKSNIEFHVERGAVIEASGNEADYRPAQTDVLQRGAGYPSVAESITLITAYHADHIAITGSGIIDGGGQKFITAKLPHIYRMKQQRPFTFFFVGCDHVDFQDIVIRDGALWTVRLSGCDDVLIHGIRILNDLKLPNSDGIDLDQCRNVRISDCHIVAGDDCICLKSCADTGDFGLCENITVTGCTLMSTSCALMVGCEAHTTMRNVIFDSCVVQSSNRGLGIHMSHAGNIENILFSNIIVETRFFHEDWWGRAEPIYICCAPWTEQDQVGIARHIRFTNILCRGESGVFVWGWEADQVRDILFENVRVEIAKHTAIPAGRLDIRPCAGEGMPEHALSGFLLRNAKNVTLRNCEVVWSGDIPESYHHAIEHVNVSSLVLENFKGESAHQERYEAIRGIIESTVQG